MHVFGKLLLYLHPKLRIMGAYYAHMCAKTNNTMSEQQLRSYRLTSLEEPTDEMLHAIMEKVADAARKSTARAEEAKRRMLAETARRIKQNRAVAL